jgi:hypothetical protein
MDKSSFSRSRAAANCMVDTSANLVLCGSSTISSVTLILGPTSLELLVEAGGGGEDDE